MNKSILLYFKQFLIAQLLHYNIYLIVHTIVLTNSNVFSKNDWNWLSWILIGFIPFGLYLARNHAKKRNILIGIHFAMVLFAAVIPAGHTLMRGLYLMIAVFYCMSSSFLLEERMKNQDIICPPFFTVLCCAGCLLALSHMNIDGWLFYYIGVTIILLYVYFLVYYLNNYVSFLMMNENNSGHIPQKDILVSGLKLLFAYLFIGLLIILATANSTWFNYILLPVKKLLVSVLRFLFSFVPLQDQVYEEMEEPEFIFDFTVKEFDISRYTDVLYTALVIAAIAILLFGVYMFFSSFISRNSYKQETKENAYDFREKCEVVQKKKKEKKKWFGLNSYEERIRKTYKKKIKKSKELIDDNIDVTSLELYTARECAKCLEKPMIAQIYEKARYSGKECKKEDLLAMKEACK